MYLHPETLDTFGEWFYNDDQLFNWDKESLLALCLHNDFPGTLKWKADNPIWDCNRAGKLTPKQAWKNEDCLKKAINNLFYMVKFSIANDKYQEFVTRVETNFILDEGAMFEVLNRFTVAKIAPKVTALRPTYFIRILEEAKIDVSCGIYCPMAGFGGIIEGAKRWFNINHIKPEGKIEAYDINKKFCDYYGWTQRDVLAQKVTTDKVVFACPPFGLSTERWDGTPMEREDKFKTNYLEFHQWCSLIKEYVKAPNYIFVGPELRDPEDSKYKSGVKANGLFHKKYGVQYYPEYSL